MAQEMKDSGVAWIGLIPADWKVAQLKRIAKIQTGNTPSKEDGSLYYSRESGYLWIKAEDLGFNKPIEKTTEYLTETGIMQGRLFPENTVFVCCIASVGKVGFSHMKASCNQQINGLVFNNAHWKYGFYVSLSQESEYLINSNGNVMKIINSDKQARLMCPLPPIEMQQRIADYLDHKCTEIDEILEKNCTSIAEYKKLKQATISQVITRGIHQKRSLKESGSIWFGSIPTTWEMRKTKKLFTIEKRIAGVEGITVLSITQKGIRPKDLSKNEGQLAASYSNYQIVHPGDFAMNHMDLLTGWVDISDYEGVTSPDYRVFTMSKSDDANKRYYLYLFQMCYFNRIYYGLGQGVSGFGRWRLPANQFLNFLIPVPPRKEQDEIVEYLDSRCAEIDALIQEKTQLLAEMEAYKKNLIYEYVTGKKEVPDAVHVN